jgi:hypothetical protein
VDAVDAKQLEKTLNDQINTAKGAKGDGQYFYIGIASRPAGAKTTIQALCTRQGSQVKKDNKDKCSSNYSSHETDQKAIESGLKLKKVFYANAFKKEMEVCGIEERIIEEYYIKKKDRLCLNRAPGKPKCFNSKARTGIVYLRIYEKKA